jgi:hypothetical protein
VNYLREAVVVITHNENTISIITIHNWATHLNRCKIRNKNETLLVNVLNSTVKNIFENGMIPKLIQ